MEEIKQGVTFGGGERVAQLRMLRFAGDLGICCLYTFLINPYFKTFPCLILNFYKRHKFRSILGDFVVYLDSVLVFFIASLGFSFLDMLSKSLPLVHLPSSVQTSGDTVSFPVLPIFIGLCLFEKSPTVMSVEFRERMKVGTRIIQICHLYACILR